MAPVASSQDLWDPFRVLEVYPSDPDCTCAGTASSTRARCRWPFDSDQFTASQRTTAVEQLRSMAEMHPSDVTPTALYSLARNTLCRDFHQGQAATVEAKWKARIQNYLREHGERLSVLGAVRELQSGIARDKDAYAQEIKQARRELEASQVQCAELTETNRRLVQDQARQLAELQTSAKTLDERNDEVEVLRRRMEVFEKDVAAISKETKGLRDSKARLDKMMTTSTMEIGGLKAKAKKSEEEAGGLRQRFESGDRDIAALKEARTSLEEKAKLSERETESLHQGLQKIDARLEEKADLSKRETESLRKALMETDARQEGKSAEDSKRMDEHFEALDQKYTETKNENTKQASRLQEQDQKIERLVKQMDGVKQELTKRDRYVGELAKHLDGLRQGSAERSRHVGQLEEQMEGLKQKAMAREVGGLVKMKIGRSGC